MRLLGWIGKQHALILVDSGSAATFIDLALAEKCGLPKVQVEHFNYIAADGGLMILNMMLPKLQWCCQGYTYCRDTKVMQLPIYDIILGADWLEEQGSMWIDWKNKVMKFHLDDREIILTGVRDTTVARPAILGKGLKWLLKRKAISHCIELSLPSRQEKHCEVIFMADSIQIPPEVQDLLGQFKEIFAEPHSLPPRRAVDHRIPLILGAQPVNVRPYRYSPQQKNEIQRQVHDMLQSSVIQLSANPFASSVLLVKKKDGS
jgi:hypothetical protein